MSRQLITISDVDIADAEMVLLPGGGHFDEERRQFIKHLGTIDLQAVPGSGKTTALLAKLLILANHLPFADGSGILVLSHTNAAVDRMTEYIGTHCPRLFAYPNFVGTIQSFVDQFLAIPYYARKYGGRPHSIDDEIYNERHFVPRQARGWLNNRHDKNDVIYKSRLLGQNRLGYSPLDGADSFPVGSNTQTYQALLVMKEDIRASGILCFDDAYVLAFEYVARCPRIREFLQKRFRYVFVDEMQDMNNVQHVILESIFHDNAPKESVYQRIGDKNQAIFSHEITLDDIWINRDTVLPLKGSHRLPPVIADVVTPFATAARVQIDGKNVFNANGTANNLPPHVIVFDEDSVGRVIQTFCELIRKFMDAGGIPKDHKHPFKAIAWRKGDDGKFGLKDYWNGYEAEAVRSKTHHTCLRSYLSFAQQEGWPQDGLRMIHRKIMGALMRVLRMEGVSNPDGRAGWISERGLLKYLRGTRAHAEFYQRFGMNMFHWSRDIYQGKLDHVYRAIRGFIPELLQVFDKRLQKASHFVDDGPPEVSSVDASASALARRKDNIYRCPTTGMEVHVGTVHSTKGETHTATLYLESYYMRDGNGPNAKSFESQRLKDQFNGKILPNTSGQRTRQSARMVYVGFSRPTHLLCFAVHKDRLNQGAFRKNGWKVVYAFEN